MSSSLRFALCAAVVLASGCEPSGPIGRLAPAPAEARGPLYSPWVVAVEGGDESQFDEISFKDVGLTSVVAASRPRTYEAIAQSLASELAEHRALPLASEARYSEAMSRPESHLACAGRHVYVDLWEAPERWGYSLWSGCGEDDRFAWEELDRTAPADDDAAIAQLTRHIAGSLRDAVRTGCFTRTC